MTTSRLVDPPAAAPSSDLPNSWPQQAARWAHRTERRLMLLVVTLVVLGLTAGITGALTARYRGAVLDDVAGHSGPLSLAAVEVYRALSDADATSASAFLAGGTEPAELRERYLNDIAAANAALSTAAAGEPTGQSAATVAELANYTPAYTGLVETARVYNRQGLPLGAAYLREASELVRATMLPAAQRLYRLETERLAASQAEAGQPPWIAIALAVLLVAGLVGAQVYLSRRTRRLLNPGLLAATALALAGVLWLSISTLTSAAHGDTSRRDGTAQIEALAEARIAGLQARGDEALTLVARGNGETFAQRFDQTARQLTDPGGLLGRAETAVDQADTRAVLSSASDAARRWLAVHAELRTLDTEGRYTEAVNAAIGTDPASAGSLAREFDGALGTAIAQAGARFDTATQDARNALSGLPVGIAVLCVLAVIAAAVGMWPRITEYR